MLPFQFPSPGSVVVWLIAVAVCSLFSLASLWATNTRASWPARLAPLSLLLALLFPIGCFEYSFLFAAQGLFILITISLIRTVQVRRARRQQSSSAPAASLPDADAPAASRKRPQFTLARALLGTLFCGVLLALIRSQPDEFDLDTWTDPQSWVEAWIAGVGQASITLASWLLVTSRRWPIALLGVLCLATAAVAARFTPFAGWIEFVLNTQPNWPLLFGLAVSHAVMLFLLLWLLQRAGWSWWRAPSQAAAYPRARAARVALIGLSAVLLLPLIDLYRALIPPSVPAPAALPDPNGYDLLISLAEQVDMTALPQHDPDTATPAQLEQYRTTNAAVLAAMAAALELPARPAIDYRQMNPPTGYDKLRDVYYVWRAAAKAAQSRGDELQAVHDYLHVLRAANVCANGALGIDELVANAMVSESLAAIVPMLPSLTGPELEDVQQQVNQTLLQREPIEPIVQRSQVHWRLSMGWSGRLFQWIADRGLGGYDIHSELPRLRALNNARLQLLIAHCALERYRSASGTYPDSLTTLVPDYLPTLPDDPLGSGPLRYRRSDRRYVLYSMGPNGRDDGGTPPSPQSEPRDGDLLLGP